jgi:hypothetical protein
MTSPPDRRSELWAITCYFNPMGWQRRRACYGVFREHLDVPLVAVELAYGTDFELDASDAEVLVQLRGRDVLVQKERLLNLALRALPAHCRKVVWVDCDIVFEAAGWADHVNGLLDRFTSVQPFSRVHYLPRDCPPGRLLAPALLTQASVASVVAAGVPARVPFDQPIGPAPGTNNKGLVWAARRALLEEHGFYDACIVGNGDRAMAGAYFGCFDEVARSMRMNDRQRQHYLTWAEPVFETVRAEVGFVNSDIFHLWHGDMATRRWGERHAGLTPFRFDPFEDVAIDENGCWRWNSNKVEMHAYVREYFASRNEDG